MQLSSLWSIKPEFRLKVGLLSLTFFFLTLTNALWRSLKGPVFSKMVGAAHAADAKIYSVFLLIPLIMIYSKLVDVLRRHQMVYVFTLLHGGLGLLLAYYLSRPDIGISNIIVSHNRTIGWVFYFFMESFSAFLSTTFWSFANSINKPHDARDYYGIFVAGSKIGGMLGTGLLWLSLVASHSTLPIFTYWQLSDEATLIATMVIGSLSLLSAAVCIYFLMKWVPGYYMHGYEAVYQVEKKREVAEKKSRFSFLHSLSSAIGGLRIIFTNPYVLGIFSLSIFYDIIITTFDFIVLSAADARYATSGEMTIFYAGYFFSMHLVGLIISLAGTTPLQRLLGNRSALLAFPLLCMGLVGLSFFYTSADALLLILIVLRAANYGMNHPIREVLYIPTTKEIKFKCKAWSDAFGTKLAKGTSAVFYKQSTALAPALSQFMSSAFTFSLTFAWVIISYFLGRSLQRAIDHKLVIDEHGISTPEKASS